MAKWGYAGVTKLAIDHGAAHEPAAVGFSDQGLARVRATKGRGVAAQLRFWQFFGAGDAVML